MTNEKKRCYFRQAKKCTSGNAHSDQKSVRFAENLNRLRSFGENDYH